MPPLSRFPDGVSVDLLEDLSKKLGTSDLLEWIEQKAEALAAYGDTGSWIELSPALLQCAGVRRYEFSSLTQGTSSLRLFDEATAVVQHHNFQGPEDRRFWIAHEIGHLMWRKPENPQVPLSPHELALGADPTIEWLCNRFAAALLVPISVLTRALSSIYDCRRSPNDPVDIRFIPSLAAKLRVPERLIARRIYHDIQSREESILCIKCPGEGSSNISGSVVWDAIPRFSVVRNKRLYGRKIPASMIPEHDVVAGDLDGRWLQLIKDSIVTVGRSTPVGRMKSNMAPAKGTTYSIPKGERDNVVILSIMTPTTMVR